MYKKRGLFVTFEGIEGSGKSYQIQKLYQKLKRNNIPAVLTREPGGTMGAERIRKIILEDYFHPNSQNQFDKYTDTLLYLASRNEHIKRKIKPAISKNKIILCDRFTDSTLAYQVFGKGVNKHFVDFIHKYILNGFRPDLTFILKVNLSKSSQRLKKRKKKNRYDKFSRHFYSKVQNAFIRIAKMNKKRYIILDTSKDTKDTEKIIFNRFKKILKNESKKN